MGDSTTKTALLVKKSDAKKGKLWHKFANDRIIKQHGGFDIPEGDLHAVQKYESPVHEPKITSDEMNTVLSDLEKEIKQLKEHDRQPFLPSANNSQNPPHIQTNSDEYGDDYSWRAKNEDKSDE